MTIRDGSLSPRALVLEHLPGMPPADAGAVLWNLTSYPFGDEAQVRVAGRRAGGNGLAAMCDVSEEGGRL